MDRSELESVDRRDGGDEGNPSPSSTDARLSLFAIDCSASDADGCVSDKRGRPDSGETLEMEVVRPLRGGSGGGVGRAGDSDADRGLFPSSVVCVREDEDDDELEGAASGVASEETSADAGLFQRRYTLCIVGFLTLVSGEGDGGSGATYPIDITSPRWLAWMPGIVIIFAWGCT
jgi:hypothetical protein